jgi:RHS repeat-associated protein
MKYEKIKEFIKSTKSSKSTIYRFYKKNEDLFAETKFTNGKRFFPTDHARYFDSEIMFDENKILRQENQSMRNLIDSLADKESLLHTFWYMDWSFFFTVAYKNERNKNSCFKQMHGGWLTTKYDVFNRPVLTSWVAATVTSATRKTLQDSQNVATVLSETKIATVTNTTINGVAFRYTTVAWPTSGYHVLTVNYYDDYNFPNAPIIPSAVETQAVYYNGTVKPKGLSTGSWVRVPETSALFKSETSYTLYDYKARVIRSYTQNHLGGYTYTDSKLNTFTGQVAYTMTRHKRLQVDAELLTKEAFTYSDQERLMTHTHQIGTGGTPELLASNTYDELGQLIGKNVGNTVAVPLQKINYAYNIRGWLTEINKVAALQQVNDPKDLFGFKINYNTIEGEAAATKALYNGNIAETFWSSGSDGVGIVRAYGYKYDNLNRLKDATFYKKGSLPYVSKSYDENLTYDKNGNIKTLLRNGDVDDALPANGIDNLAYTYATNSNKLLNVFDNSNNTSGFNDVGRTGDDYTYDANGNMITDKNKNITAITYNHLNLPAKITFGTTGNIVYLYNAVGQKVKKIFNLLLPTPTVVTTDYLGGYQYSGGVLQFFPTAEGYVKNTAGVYSYVFNYTDHLGNVRLSYTKNTDGSLAIIDENNYYPFGLKHKVYNDYTPTSNKYKYNGKELQDELGLNMYDYGARNYDPALGRWINIDPLAEKSRRFSPYVYALNNPVFFIDPDGMEAGPGPSWLRTAAFAISHPIAAISIGEYVRGSTNISTNATRFATTGSILQGTKATRENPEEGSQNGAFRHTLWQATITSKFGAGIAKEAGDAHEENPSAETGSQMVFSLAEADQAVDLSNNIIGREIGAANPDLGMKDLATKVLDTFKTDGLYTATKIKVGQDQTQDAYTVTRTKLSDDQYNKMSSALSGLNDNGRTPSQQKAQDDIKRAESARLEKMVINNGIR